jgi:hypothetical protein
MLHSTGSLKFRKWEIDWANGEQFAHKSPKLGGSHQTEPVPPVFRRWELAAGWRDTTELSAAVVYTTDHLTGPEVGLGVLGDVVQLLIDVVEQSDDQIPCGHAALLSGV